MRLKFGIDGGRGFLKVCLSVLPEFDDDADSSAEKEKSGRQTYAEGILAKKSLESGVKKLFILAVCPHVQEHYENVSILWEKLCMNEFDATLAPDLKLANIID